MHGARTIARLLFGGLSACLQHCTDDDTSSVGLELFTCHDIHVEIMGTAPE